MKEKRIIVWFRNDLRLHDNEALTEAIKKGTEIIPVFVFDDRTFKEQTQFGFEKTGPFRCQFTIEAVEDLRANLKKLGINLVVRIGLPENIIAELALQTQARIVCCNNEPTYEESKVQKSLEDKLILQKCELQLFRGKMLYYTKDLPFPVSKTPDIFTQFRKEVEKSVNVRMPLPAPTAKLEPWSVRIEEGIIPTVQDFGHDAFVQDERAALTFKGGETAAIERLKHYFWESNALAKYKETRNGLIGADYSSKFSPWLAQGSISPKWIYEQVKKYEHERVSNDSTYWLIFELLWRDFFRFQGKKHGNKMFLRGGTSGKPDTALRQDERLFTIWAEGRTGVPFIDANMRELAQTGFMSNRGRQNVASFLVKDLKVDWRMGAEWFESLLLDYDPCSNYGNWNYVAGVGNDPRENRYFNILRQATMYDAHGDYVRIWCPELSKMKGASIHRPDLLSFDEQQKLGIRIGAEYPKAMVNIVKWV